MKLSSWVDFAGVITSPELTIIESQAQHAASRDYLQGPGVSTGRVTFSVITSDNTFRAQEGIVLQAVWSLQKEGNKENEQRSCCYESASPLLFWLLWLQACRSSGLILRTPSVSPFLICSPFSLSISSIFPFSPNHPSWSEMRCCALQLLHLAMTTPLS